MVAGAIGARGADGGEADVPAAVAAGSNVDVASVGVPEVFDAIVFCSVEIKSSALEAATPDRKNMDTTPLNRIDPAVSVSKRRAGVWQALSA
jgi:hypothetical protein